MSDYEFDRYDNIDRLEIIMKYDNLFLVITKFEGLPYAIFGVNGVIHDKGQALCLGNSIEEIEYKLNKICKILDNSKIKYIIDRVGH